MKPKHIANVLATDLLEIAHGIDCAPGEPATFERDGRKLLNNYVPPLITAKPGNWSRIKAILEVVTEGDTRGMAWLVNWMAAKVQNPGARSMTAPVFQGLQGTGKSTLGVILAHIIGVENSASISQDDLEGTFNLHYVSKLLVLADEVVNRDNIRATDSKLKKFITDPVVIANGKNTPQFQLRNRMSWWFTSNNPLPVRVEGEHDRRYTVFCCSTPPTPEYKAMLNGLYLPNNEFKPDFLEEIAAFAQVLKTFKVDLAAAARPYENAARAELAAAGRSSTEAFFEEVVAVGIDALVAAHLKALPPNAPVEPWDFKQNGVTVDAVYAAYRRFCEVNGFNGPVSKQTLGKDMRMKQPTWKKERLSTGGREYLWTSCRSCG